MEQFITKTPLNLKCWNQLIHSSTRNGFYEKTLHLYSSMHAANLHADQLTLPFVAKACAKLRSISGGRKIHAHAIVLGFNLDVFVQTSLLDMYAKCSCLSECRQVFDEMPVRSLVTWNSMIDAYSSASRSFETIQVFNEMMRDGLKPSESACVSLISGCREALWHGLSAYSYAIKTGLSSDLHFSNSLLTLLAKFGFIHEACAMFDSMQERSVVTWTALMTGYVNCGDHYEVFNLFNKLHEEEVHIDLVMALNLMTACAQSGNGLLACSIHALWTKKGIDHEGFIPSALVNLYSKCKDLRLARKIFDSEQDKDVSLWTSIISAYVRHDLFDEALELFQSLLSTTTKPNQVTMTTILSACARFGTVAMASQVEDSIIANGLDSDIRVLTALVRMHCKHGSIKRAKEIFDKVSEKDLMLWSTMISGYAYHGKGKEALDLFNQLQNNRIIKPDSILFTDLLSACSHSGLVTEGLQCFKTMQTDYGIKPTTEHYLCITDLLNRAGKTELAMKFVESVPAEVKTQVMDSFVSSSRLLDNGISVNDSLLDDRAFNDFGTKGSGNYVKMANVHASMGNWNKVVSVRELMEKKGLIKEVGWTKFELCCS